MKAREKLLFCGSQGVQGLKDLAAAGGFDGPVHLVILAAAQESVDPNGQAHSRMQPKASACRERENGKKVSEKQKVKKKEGERKGFRHEENYLTPNCGSPFLVL